MDNIYFPYYYDSKIVAVYKANINTEDIKTDDDLENVLKPYDDIFFNEHRFKFNTK